MCSSPPDISTSGPFVFHMDGVSIVYNIANLLTNMANGNEPGMKIASYGIHAVYCSDVQWLHLGCSGHLQKDVGLEKGVR